MKTAKVITRCSLYDDAILHQAIGVYSSEEIGKAIQEIKTLMLEKGYVLVNETKDCCDYNLRFKNEKKTGHNRLIVIFTESFIINELMQKPHYT